MAKTPRDTRLVAALAATRARVKECQGRLAAARLLGNQADILSKQEKLAVAERRLNHIIKHAAKTVAKSAAKRRKDG